MTNMRVLALPPNESCPRRGKVRAGQGRAGQGGTKKASFTCHQIHPCIGIKLFEYLHELREFVVPVRDELLALGGTSVGVMRGEGLVRDD